MWFERDSEGNVLEFDVIYHWGGWAFSHIDDESNPEFVGMDPSKLSESCTSSPCQ